MKTKIIPFNYAVAKEIQKGNIEGKIRTKNELPCQIVAQCGTDFFVKRRTTESPFDWCYPYTKDGKYIDGHLNGGADYDLVIEVPDNEPQFKPFDKVLMRNVNTNWYPTIFSNKELTGFRNIGGELCAYCIPYEGNEDLVGTTKNPKED